ncbi:hypothetical protein H6769_06205 [Candidatus Peribacteria bacterium]|nr:hypothetical protein [Candidatus Peribacteria bacterium]
MLETSVQESIRGEQIFDPLIQNSPQQEDANSIPDISSDGASGSVIPFYKEISLTT